MSEKLHLGLFSTEEVEKLIRDAPQEDSQILKEATFGMRGILRKSLFKAVDEAYIDNAKKWAELLLETKELYVGSPSEE
jgi:hypothetical protein